MYTMDIDTSSPSSEVVILQGGIKVAAAAVVSADIGTNDSKRLLAQTQEQSGLSPADVIFILPTGYGRSLLAVADLQMSEISCRAKGVFFQNPVAQTIIDTRGQDVKAISLDSQGNAHQFYMNDKYTAGTGRSLETTSHVLEVKLGEVVGYHFRSKHPVSVGNTYTVFAESEVTFLLSQGRSKEDVVAGAHRSVAAKAYALAQRADIENEVILCGRAALNRGVADAIQTEFDERLAITCSPQLIGALGAARLAYKEAKRKRKSA